MGTKIINRETIAQERYQNGYSAPVDIFKGSSKFNLSSKEPVLIGKKRIVKMASPHWVDSANYNKLWNEIEDTKKRINAAQTPSASDLEDLLGKLFIDITRRAMESPDLTSRVCTEITDLGFPETVNLKEIYKYRGQFGVIAGTNDSVNLIQQRTGETDTVDMTIRALGWKDSLANMLYNRLHSMQKVNEAVSDADIDMRNKLVVGEIVGATYDSEQTESADETSGATYDVKMYNTLRKAIKKLRNLEDYRTDRKISVPSISILCNPYDSWSIQRVVGGQLTSGGANGVLTSVNTQALPIGEIIEYDQGITDGFTWGNETLDFPGVTAGTCYVFVPREYAWVLNKRPLTLETGMGSTLQLSTEERAWYRVQSEFLKIFLGSSYSGTSLGSGYGAIVEVTLPTDS